MIIDCTWYLLLDWDFGFDEIPRLLSNSALGSQSKWSTHDHTIFMQSLLQSSSHLVWMQAIISTWMVFWWESFDDDDEIDKKNYVYMFWLFVVNWIYRRWSVSPGLRQDKIKTPLQLILLIENCLYTTFQQINYYWFISPF